MVFNSAVYIFFFVVILIFYHSFFRIPGSRKIQNIFLLVASYYFYGYWDWVFLGLIVLSTLIDYFVALGLENEEREKRRRILLSISVFANLGLLGVFKYYDFFIKSFVLAVHSIFPGLIAGGADNHLLRLALPVGISFYTFQTMSYTIDVYRRIIRPERDFLDFALFVCFFPQLVAGPIERAGDLLSQIKKDRKITAEDVEQGLWLLLLGFYMKVYVADNLSPLVDRVYLPSLSVYHAHPEMAAGHGGGQVLVASMAFAMQIYGDFAGYSFIAMGSALLMGFRLSLNFDTPELSENPADLWRRWHITLGRWVMDYVYIPLGGSRQGSFYHYRNLFLTFLVMGFWHGANWTFVLWGAYHGIWLIIHANLKKYLWKLPDNASKWLRLSDQIFRRSSTFLIFALSAPLFRGYDLGHAVELYSSLFHFPWNLSGSVRGVPPFAGYFSSFLRVVFLAVLMDIAMLRRGTFWIFRQPVALRSLIYILLFFYIVVQGVFGKDVIYFAF